MVSNPARGWLNTEIEFSVPVVVVVRLFYRVDLHARTVMLIVSGQGGSWTRASSG